MWSRAQNVKDIKFLFLLNQEIKLILTFGNVTGKCLTFLLGKWPSHYSMMMMNSCIMQDCDGDNLKSQEIMFWAKRVESG